MRKFIKLLIPSILILNLLSCEKDANENFDFYKLEDRIGIWVNSERGDTLEFIDNSNLIRKGDAYSNEEYNYHIDGETLFIGINDSTNETQHPIIKIEEKSVTLGNMYISIGFTDNPGTFIKQN